MSDPDFTGIDPLRLAEARRRIAIIEDYLAKSKRSGHETAQAARAIGVNRSQFYILVRA